VSDDPVTDNPVLGALAAFNRTHPHREVDEDEVVANAKYALDEDGHERPPIDETQEALALDEEMDRPEWA
jgi:hypothetical protein